MSRFSSRFHRLLSLASILGLALCVAAAQAKQTFRIHVDAQNEVVRDVDTFEVVKVGGGYATLKLVPFQPDVVGTLIQLGKKNKLGEVPVPGEATWLAYVPSAHLAVVRLATTLSESDVPPGTVVLSVRPDPKAVAPVDGALEAAKALVGLNDAGDARTLLHGMAADPKYESDRCRLLKALLDLQMPAAPTDAKPLPPDSETTLRTLLSNCTGVEADAAAKKFVQWTLERLAQEKKAGASPADRKSILQDATSLINGRPEGDRLLLALAQLYDQTGDAEQGSRAIEDFFKKYPSSAYNDEARKEQEALARRSPARGYRAVGTLGQGRLTQDLGIREVTDLAFDDQGRLLVLDGRSKPRKLLVVQINPEQRTLETKETYPLPKSWDPIAVCAAADGKFYLIDSDEDQLVSFNPADPSGAEVPFPTRGDGWKLRRPRRLCIVGNDILVLDTSSEKLYHFGIRDHQYEGAIDLYGHELRDALDVASAPDGKVLVATEETFSVFDPSQTPSTPHKAMRGRTYQLEVNRAAMSRWKYVYLFDTENERLEMFRRSGEWLTTVVDCEKTGIRDPGPWTVSREGDVVLYNYKTDQLYYFTQ